MLASSSDATAGAVVTLSGVAVPADGIYKIRVSTAAGHGTSTGYYYINASDTTANRFALNLGQQSAGNIAQPSGVDQWSFSAGAGQQLQFNLLNSSSSAVVFQLLGPGGEVLFHDFTGNSVLANLPAAGTYTLSAYGLAGGTGTYNFVLKQTSLTILPLGTTYNGTWAGSGQPQLFTVPVADANPLLFALTDAAAADHTEIYARFGTPPTREAYDFAVNGTGGSHRILVPMANVGTWYVLVYGESIRNVPAAYTLQASSAAVILTNSSTYSSAATASTVIALSGAGFNAGTKVGLLGTNGALLAADTVSVNSAASLTAVFPVGTVPAGTYTIQVTQPDGTVARLPTPFVVAAFGQAVLTTHLEVPNPIGRHIATVLYVNYSNTGNSAMPAPLLVLRATNPSGNQGAIMTLQGNLQTSGFWTSANPAGFSQSIQILANGALPGVLQAGESRRVPVYYDGWLLNQWDFVHNNLNFSLAAVQADDPTPVDWAAREGSLQPAGIPSAAWHNMYTSLLARLGDSAGGYVRLLDDCASYLGLLDEDASDTDKLWGFAVSQTANLWPSPSLGDVVDASLPVPGTLSMAFKRAFNNSIPGRFQTSLLGLGWQTPWRQRLDIAGDGTVTLRSGDGGRLVYQPDSRSQGKYISQPGDFNTLAAVNGGAYLLTAVSGEITAFAPDGRLSYLQDNNGNRITAGYNGDAVASLTASSGQSFALTYNGAGLLATITDSVGRTTRYTYDAANRHLSSVLSPQGRTTAYTYDEAEGSPSRGALASITFADGSRQQFTYDGAGRLRTSAANGGAELLTFGYANGQVSVTDALGNSSSLYFNAQGQISKAVNASGSSTFYRHNDRGGLVKTTNALGATASYAYNSFGETASTTDFSGQVTRFAYDGSHHQLSRFTDANGNITQYTRDNAGNRLSTLYANGRNAVASYDPVGNALSSTNPAGELLQFAHNAAGLLTGVSFSDGSSYAYNYDAKGNLQSATDAAGSVLFTYDPVTETLTKATYPNGLDLSFGYDSGGRRISMADQDGFTVNYVYDAVGRLSNLRDASNRPLLTYVYDEAGRLSRKTNGNGTYTVYEHDGNGRILHLVNHAPDGTVTSRFDDTYDTLGFKTGEITLDGAWTYSYDSGGQLLHAVFASVHPGSVPNQDLRYNYDAVGNRTSSTINGVATSYSVNNMNQYLGVGTTSYSYDAKGNLISDGTGTYSYDVLNHLTGIDNGSGPVINSYNALMQLSASANSSSGATRYLVDPIGAGSTVAAIKNGVGAAKYVHGLQLAGSVSAAGTFYHDFDPLGSTVGISDANGTVVASYTGLPFGEQLVAGAAVDNPFQFEGGLGVAAAPNGLSNMRARHYKASLGRFVSADPLELAGGDANLYRYCANSPTRFVDPSGLRFYFEGVNGGPNEFYGFSIGKSAGRSVGISFGGGAGFSSGVHIGPALTLGAAINAGIASIGEGIGSELGLSAGYSEGVSRGASIGYAKGSTVGFIIGYAPDPDPPGGSNSANSSTETVNAADPNALYGPTGYGAANFVCSLGNAFAYRITYENDPTASAPAQSVAVSQSLSPYLDWSTFQLTGVGFGDNNLIVPPGSQHYQTTVSMSWNNQTFDVQIEAGIHTDTGQVYAVFQSIDPNTSLPPASVLTGFLPPEDGTGRGEGYINYTVSPRATTPTSTVIRSVAYVTFDGGQTIATNQVSETNPAAGTDPTKEAPVTIDANVPTSHIISLPRYVGATFDVSWSGSNGAGGSGIAGYTVHVSSDGGRTYAPWLVKTQQTSATYTGIAGKTYSFYVVATNNVGTVQQNAQAGAVSTQAVAMSPIQIWRLNYFNTSTNAGVAADTATPDNDGITNLIKYAAVIPPGQSGVKFLPMTEVLNALDGNHLALAFVRDPLRNDITIQVQAADSPAGPWTAVAQSANGGAFAGSGYVRELNAGDGLISVEVGDPAVMSGAHRFLRLMASDPQTTAARRPVAIPPSRKQPTRKPR